MVDTLTTDKFDQRPSFEFDADGNPVIVYHDYHILKYAAFDGEKWNISTVDDSEGKNGEGNSLAFSPDGTPHIAYSN